MTDYLYHVDELKRGVQPLDFMSCKRIELTGTSPAHEVQSGPNEVAVVCLSGQADYKFGTTSGTMTYKDFLYLPWKSRLELTAPHNAILMQIGSPCHRDTDFAHLRYSEIAKDPNRHKVFGLTETSSLRDVYMFLDDKFNASRLMMGICEGTPGAWTSWPPHEHAKEREELYVYFDMGKSFSIQCVYEDLATPLFCGFVRDGDMVAIPKGFHPNVSCPGGRITYLYAMAARTPGKRDFMALNIQREFGEKLE
ncbi:MAG TPA: 5-deoxy-glucuronate isomerase [Anaerolineae bacterium]